MSRVDEPMRRDRLRRPKPNGRIGACPRFPSKNRYQDRGQAERAARLSSTNPGSPPITPYACRHCKGWHLTSHPRSR